MYDTFIKVKFYFHVRQRENVDIIFWSPFNQ